MAAKKRRIKKITVESVPKWADCMEGPPPILSFVITEARDVCGPKGRCILLAVSALQAEYIGLSPSPRMTMTGVYLCSKSTGALTSCTRKYFASAGYFRATASYIAYATLRYETCPAGVVRNSDM